MMDALTLSGVAQARLIREGKLSAVELVETCLSRIEEINPQINAAVDVMAESARKAACEADRRRVAGQPTRPFEGVPFSIKNSIDVEGRVCTAGTVGFRNNPPSTCDATLVARIR